MKIWVEVHPASAIMPPEMKRWRVMCDGWQQSVHETEAEAETAAGVQRQRAAVGGAEPTVTAIDSSNSRQDRRR